MALDSKTVELGDLKFEIGQLPFGTGKKVLFRLLKSLSPVLEDVQKALPEGQDLTDPETELDWTLILSSLVKNLSEEDLDFATEKFGSVCKFYGKEHPVPLSSDLRDVVFAANYGVYFRWLVECTKFNFGNFSNGGGLEKLLRQVKQ